MAEKVVPQALVQEIPDKSEKDPKPMQAQRSKSVIWDCNSSLYDSFELQSFKRQLDSAIASRCLSMPRESECMVRPASSTSTKRSSWKISRSFQKLVRSVLFRPKASSTTSVDQQQQQHPDQSDGGFYVVYQRQSAAGGFVGDAKKAGILPEPEDFDVVVRRTRSERFADAAIPVVGIACV